MKKSIIALALLLLTLGGFAATVPTPVATPQGWANWATGPSAVYSVPSSGKQALGWVSAEKPPFQWWNWLCRTTAQSLAWLKNQAERSDARLTNMEAGGLSNVWMVTYTSPMPATWAAPSGVRSIRIFAVGGGGGGGHGQLGPFTNAFGQWGCSGSGGGGGECKVLNYTSAGDISLSIVTGTGGAGAGMLEDYGHDGTVTTVSVYGGAEILRADYGRGGQSSIAASCPCLLDSSGGNTSIVSSGAGGGWMSPTNPSSTMWSIPGDQGQDGRYDGRPGATGFMVIWAQGGFGGNANGPTWGFGRGGGGGAGSASGVGPGGGGQGGALTGIGSTNPTGGAGLGGAVVIYY